MLGCAVGRDRECPGPQARGAAALSPVQSHSVSPSAAESRWLLRAQYPSYLLIPHSQTAMIRLIPFFLLLAQRQAGIL